MAKKTVFTYSPVQAFEENTKKVISGGDSGKGEKEPSERKPESMGPKTPEMFKKSGGDSPKKIQTPTEHLKERYFQFEDLRDLGNISKQEEIVNDTISFYSSGKSVNELTPRQRTRVGIGIDMIKSMYTRVGQAKEICAELYKLTDEKLTATKNKWIEKSKEGTYADRYVAGYVLGEIENVQTERRKKLADEKGRVAIEAFMRVLPDNGKMFGMKSVDEFKKEYNKRREKDLSLPEWGSYDFYVDLAYELRPYVEVRDDDFHWRDATIGINDPRVSGKRKYIDAYLSILNVVGILGHEGLYFNKDGSVNIAAGHKQAKTEDELYGAAYNALGWKASHLGMFEEAGLLNEDGKIAYAQYDDVRAPAEIAEDVHKAYQYYDKYKDKSYDDNFLGWVSGGWRQGDIGLKRGDAGKTLYDYKSADTEAADVYDLLSEKIVKNSGATFDEGNWFKNSTLDVARYAPQGIRQAVSYGTGYAVGAFFSVGNTKVASVVGNLFSSADMYGQTAGQAYLESLKSGLSVEDAYIMARNEAAWSAGIEFGIGCLFDMVGGKVANKIFKTTLDPLNPGKLTSVLMKAGMSHQGANKVMDAAYKTAKFIFGNFGEGTEEFLQEGLSITAQRYAKEGRAVSATELLRGCFDFSEYTDEDFSRMKDSFKTGFVVGTFTTAVRSMGDSVTGQSKIEAAQRALKNTDAEYFGNAILGMKESDVLLQRAVAIGKESKNRGTSKLANDVDAALMRGESISAEKAGRLTKRLLLDGQNVLAISNGESTRKDEVYYQVEDSGNDADNDVVFYSTDSNDAENKSIKKQIREKMGDIMLSPAVADIKYDVADGKSVNQMETEVLQILSEKGKNADANVVREGFGVVDLSYKKLKKGLKYLRTAPELYSLPYAVDVVKKGVQIYYESSHKSTGNESFTFAAPVKINGVPHAMGVVVQRSGITGGNKYHVHRVILPNGSSLVLGEKKQRLHPGSVFQENERPVSPITAVSNTIISQNSEKNNENMKKVSLQSAERVLTPEQQELKGKFERTVGGMGYAVITNANRSVPDGTIGYVDFTNKEIYISPGHFSESLLTHELTHVIDRGYNGKYIKSLFSFFKENLSEEWNKTYDEVKSKYEEIAEKNADFTYTDSTLEAETLAEMCVMLSDEKYINMAKDMNVSTIKQICLMFKYMASKITMFFNDESTAHKMKIASLKWQMALYRATKKGANDSSLNSNTYYSKLESYTEKEKQNWAGSKTILLYENKEQFKRFVEDVLQNKNTEKKIYFGKIPAEAANRILQEIGYDVRNLNVALKGYEVRKILLNSHGNENVEALRGQEMITIDDLINIPDIISNPDNISPSVYEGKPAILFEKMLAGKNYVLTYVSRKHHDLAIQTMYKKRSLASAGNANALPSTSKTTAGTASNSSIPQNTEKDNKNISTNDDILMAVSDDEGSAGIDTSAIEEEISIIDEALKDESLSSADRVALIKEKVRLQRELSGRRDVAGKEDTARTKKLEDAVDAYRESGDTSGIPTRRSVAASKKYYDAKAADIEAEMKQVYEALSNKEYLSDMEYDELCNRYDALRTQWREAAKKNSVLAEVSDIHDEIDTAARPNHTWVRDIAGWLADKKNLIKYGTYNLNDIERNFKIFFGKHFKTAYDKIIQPLYDSKKAYVFGVTEYADRLKKEIVDGLGIKKGSKESAAVMWLGEGQKPQSKKAGAELAPYTYRDCVAEFGEDAAKKIQKATEIFREMYDELLDQVNETRAMLYPNNPDKLIPKRSDYFRHFQEMSQGFEGLKNILQTNIGIDPMLVGVSENTKPKSKWQSFAQSRTGNRTTYDAVGGFLDYLPAAQYSIHIDPNIVNVRSLAYDLASAKAAENNGNGNPNANGFIAYLQRYANSLAGKTTSHFDRAIQDSNFGRTAMAVVSWLNNKTKASAVLGNINSVLSQVTNIKNVIGKIEHQSDVVRGALEALAGINPNSEISARYNDSGFLKERYLDRVFSQFDRGWDKVNPVKWAADLLGYADEIGTRITWNAGYNEAVRKNVANPVQYADNFTRACVAGRGIGEEALVFKSQLAKMFLPFRTEVLNDLRVQQDILFGEEYDIWEKNTDKSTDNEKNYVDLSFDNELVSRVEGMQGAGKYKVIRDFILEQLGDKDIVFSDGLTAKVDRSDAAHIASSAATKKTTYISKIDELIKKAELYATANEVEHNKFDEFKYYRVVVKLEGKTYPVYLNVGRAKNGDGYHIYDITKKIGESQSTAFERVNKDLRSKIDSPIDYSISQDEGKSNTNVSTEYDAFDEIVNMGKADGSKNKTSIAKRVKNIMQLYVASMVVNAVIAAIKSDEFEPLEEAKEGYEENGLLGALMSVMEDYADGTGNPVAFDPIYDIATGIYQGVNEGESAGGDVGRAALRTAQNLAGDLVSNNPFSTAVMGMIGFDNDASELLFNGNVYVPGGMGMPLAGSVTNVMRELGQGDYASAAAATVKPFLPMGTQIDRSAKGIYDWSKGYATDEAAYDRMAGQEGSLKYLIEKTPETFIKSLLFGPGAFSGESDEFYNDKTRKFTPEEQAEILSHKDYASRKVTFDDILAMNVYDSERDERKQAAAEEFFLGKEGTVLYNLYMSGIEAAVPYKNMAGDTSFTDSKTGKKYTLDLKANELEKLTGEVSDKIAARFDRANESEVFASLSQEEQEKYLEAVANAEYKQAKIKALYDSGQMSYEDYFRLESNYMEAEARRDRVLYVDDASVYVEFNAADTVGQYISYSDVPISEEGYEQLQKWRDYSSTRKPDNVDRELLRLSNATGSDINVSGNPYGIISYSKNKVDYKIELPDNQIYVLCDEVDKAVRSALSSLFAKATYKNAAAEVQKDMVASVKRDVRGNIKDKYKAKYKSVKVDEFDRIVDMR